MRDKRVGGVLFAGHQGVNQFGHVVLVREADRRRRQFASNGFVLNRSCDAGERGHDLGINKLGLCNRA